MFERFTERARECVVQAQAEARELSHGWIGTEHLLLGVASIDDGIGAGVLGRAGIDHSAIREDVIDLIGAGPREVLGPGDAEALRTLGIDLAEIRRRMEEVFGPGALERGVAPRGARGRRGRTCGPVPGAGHIPFTPRAKKVLELSLREALRLGHRYIGTEHLLLGLVREGEGMAANILVRRGAGLDEVRRMVIEALRGPGDASGPLVPSA